MNADDLFQILYLALIEIREEARGLENKAIFRIADATHNLPSILELYKNGKITPEDAVSRACQAVEVRGMKPWLEHHIQRNLKHSD